MHAMPASHAVSVGVCVCVRVRGDTSVLCYALPTGLISYIPLLECHSLSKMYTTCQNNCKFMQSNSIL